MPNLIVPFFRCRPQDVCVRNAWVFSFQHFFNNSQPKHNKTKTLSASLVWRYATAVRENASLCGRRVVVCVPPHALFGAFFSVAPAQEIEALGDAFS